MNNRKYNTLLARVMMLPFTKDVLNDHDYFYEYSKNYKALISLSEDGKRTTWNSIKSNYYKAYDELKEFALDNDNLNNIDVLCRILDMFFSGSKLVESIDSQNNGIDSFYIDYILDIARVFVTFRDGRISIRNWSKSTDPFLNNYSEYEKIDLWNNISRTVTIDLFIAATYVNFNVDENYIFNVPNLVSLADMPLKVVLSRGIAETHMHANAGISYERVWRKQMQFYKTSEKVDKKREKELWFCTFFRYYSAMFIRSNIRKNSFKNFIFDELEEEKRFDWFIKYLQNKESTFDSLKLDMFLVNNSIKNNDRIDQDILYEEFYYAYKDRNVAAEITWYIDMLKYLNDNNDHFLCQCFLKYIRFKNTFFSDKIQQTRIHGLDYFSKIYDNATDTQISKDRLKYYYVFEEQFKYGNLVLLEMKITPKTENHIIIENIAKDSIKRTTLKQIQDIFSSYKEYCDKRYSKVKEKNNVMIPKIGIIYHFIKKDDCDIFCGVNCVFANRSGSLCCNDYISMRRRYMVYMNALNDLLYDNPILTQYIVGIDAASKENDTEPWVFAPVFKIARSNKRIIPCVNTENGGVSNIQNIGFTYHVGEDYRHIVSGLRHIDEVLTHFNYRSGDRLGHALALGADIDYLVSLNSIVAIPIMEYLENLLWMWQYVNSTSDIGNIPENLEFKIMETARQIYNCNISGIDVYTLWRVYQDKFKLYEESCDHNEKCNSQCSILKKLNSSEEKWGYNELLMSHFCPCFYEIYHKPIFVQMNTNVEFYKELQNSLIKKAERMGVYVETNPTSNAAIGDIPSILEHPIIRLNNRGLSIPNISKSCVLVSINSDDPIVFSTHVENELAYIYYSLLNAGCKREEALEWIDKIRRHGIDSSFIKNKRQGLKEVYRDINHILSLSI